MPRSHHGGVTALATSSIFHNNSNADRTDMLLDNLLNHEAVREPYLQQGQLMIPLIDRWNSVGRPRICVIGDLILDCYHWGGAGLEVERVDVSREEIAASLRAAKSRTTHQMVVTCEFAGELANRYRRRRDRSGIRRHDFDHRDSAEPVYDLIAGSHRSRIFSRPPVIVKATIA
jgi:hypothetical protein